ncbi:MAG TPA: DUF3108 domain-containing protein [Gammaproteobacteria bacterium]|nr:DUF3108 domain-containing protein [Gammaproteobacteria bacterium]
MYKPFNTLLRTLLLPLLVLILHTQTAAAGSKHQLPEFHARYAVLFMGMKVAEADYTLKHTDSGYRFSQQTRLYGLAKLLRKDTVDAVSLVEEKNGRLLLQQYEYIQRGGDAREEKFSIQWNENATPVTGLVTGHYENRETRLTTKGPVWEPLSFQLPLMLEADAGKKEYPYKAVIKGEMDTYHFVAGKTKKVHFAGRDYQALEVVRTDPRPDRDWSLHLWLIPELHNIPFLIDNYRDGKLHSRAKLEQVQFGNGEKLVHKDDSDNEF